MWATPANRANAWLHSGNAWPRDNNRSGLNTEYGGRLAGRPACSVVIGTTEQQKPISRTMACANSYHVHCPRLVTWITPSTSFLASEAMEAAKSSAYVGQPD